MQQLAGPGADNNELIKELFLGRLPRQVRIVLSTSEERSTLQQLAETADKMIEVIDLPSSNVNAISDNSRFSRFESQLSELTAEVQSLKLSRDRSKRRFTRRHSRSRSRSRRNSNGFCFYHDRFRERARKCEQPCSFKPSNQENSPPQRF